MLWKRGAENKRERMGRRDRRMRRPLVKKKLPSFSLLPFANDAGREGGDNEKVREGKGQWTLTREREPDRSTQVDKPGSRWRALWTVPCRSPHLYNVHRQPSPLPAVDNLVHVVLGGQPVGHRSRTGCRCHLLRSPSSLLAFHPILPLAVLRRRAQAAV